MNGVSVTRDTYRMMAPVPEDVLGMPAEGEGEWAVWHGVTCTPADGRNAVVLVSIAVTPFRPGEPADGLAARLRDRHPECGACIEEFVTADGNPAVSVRRVVTQRVNGRDVTTGQAQALVAYPDAQALGVVSALALDPGDLDRAAELVTGIAAGMTVTGAPAAA
jgi:hypothetical protein